jgi:hypothetical protein
VEHTSTIAGIQLSATQLTLSPASDLENLSHIAAFVPEESKQSLSSFLKRSHVMGTPRPNSSKKANFLDFHQYQASPLSFNPA